MDEFLKFFEVAPAWATLAFIVVMLVKKNPFDKLVGGGIKIEDIEKIVAERVNSVKDEVKTDIRELRAIIIKHIEKD